MRAPAWGGAPVPASDAEARRRLVDAACSCFERFGFEKTGLSDVAAEAGVTRRTVYRYFDNTDELMRAAFALVAGGIVDRMVAHARRFDDPGDRIIEAMLFLRREIPADPHLGPLFSPGRDAMQDRNMWSAVATEVSHGALRAVAEPGPVIPVIRMYPIIFHQGTISLIFRIFSGIGRIKLSSSFSIKTNCWMNVLWSGHPVNPG